MRKNPCAKPLSEHRKRTAVAIHNRITITVLFGAREGTRTPTAFTTRTSNVLVYHSNTLALRKVLYRTLARLSISFFSMLESYKSPFRRPMGVQRHGNLVGPVSLAVRLPIEICGTKALYPLPRCRVPAVEAVARPGWLRESAEKHICSGKVRSGSIEVR